jgi:hypothetical protein
MIFSDENIRISAIYVIMKLCDSLLNDKRFFKFFFFRLWIFGVDLAKK